MGNEYHPLNGSRGEICPYGNRPARLSQFSSVRMRSTVKAIFPLWPGICVLKDTLHYDHLSGINIPKALATALRWIWIHITNAADGDAPCEAVVLMHIRMHNKFKEEGSVG